MDKPPVQWSGQSESVVVELRPDASRVGAFLVLAGQSVITVVLATIGIAIVLAIASSFSGPYGDFLGPFLPVLALVVDGPIALAALLGAAYVARATLRRNTSRTSLARIDEIALAISFAALAWSYVGLGDDPLGWTVRVVAALIAAGSLIGVLGFWRLSTPGTQQRNRYLLVVAVGVWASLSIAFIAFYPTGAHPPYCTPNVDPCALETWRSWWIESRKGLAILGGLVVVGVVLVAFLRRRLSVAPLRNASDF